MKAFPRCSGPGPTTLSRTSGPHVRPTADRPLPAGLCFPAWHSTVLGPQPSLPAVVATVPAFGPRLHLGHPTERDTPRSGHERNRSCGILEVTTPRSL